MGKYNGNKSKQKAGQYGKGKDYKSGQHKKPSSDKVCSAKHEGYDAISSNDIAWYNRSPIYTEATKVSFDKIMGVCYQTGMNAVRSTGDMYAVPGVVRYEYYPTIGYSNEANSPVNRAFTSLYGDLAGNNLGNMPFMQADLAMFTTSMSSIASMLGHLKRCLEVCDLYSAYNYYYPKALLTALTLDPDDATYIIDHRNDLCIRLKTLIQEFNQFRLPNFVDIFKRQYALSHNVYADEDNITASLSVFVPRGVYRYVDTEGKCVMSFPINEDGEQQVGITRFEDCLRLVKAAIEDWRNTSVFAKINGRLGATYSADQFVTLEIPDLNRVLVPVFDRNITWQINNMIIADQYPGDITQNPAQNLILSNPSVTVNTVRHLDALSRKLRIINSYDGNTSAEFIMESTRLIPFVEIPQPQGTPTEWPATLYTKTKCTELVVRGVIITYQHDVEDPNPHLVMTAFTSVNAYNKNPHIAAKLDKFRNGPRLPIFVTELDDPEPGDSADEYYGESGDLNVWTTIEQYKLETLHEAALQSLYWTDNFNITKSITK